MNTKKFSFISYLRLYLIFFVILLTHRIAFWFINASGAISSHEAFKAWWLGIRFDIRIISIFFLISFGFFLLLNPFFKILKNKSIFYLMQKIWFSLGLGCILISMWVDFGNYSYLGERLSSKMFALLANPDIALGMVMQSYPVALLFLAFISVFMLIYFVIAKFGFVFKEEQFFNIEPIKPLYISAAKYVGIFFLLAITIHSKFSQYPLRWSEAYFSRNHFLNQFALNPIQNVYDTYKFNKQTLSQEEIVKSIVEVQKELSIPEDPKNLLLLREQKVNPVLPKDTNVVVIMMESLAAFKLGHFQNPFNTTPHLDEIIKEGMLFDNFHVVQTGTAASIFCFMTGTPDLNEEETASRNPLVVDQHTMINNIKNHSKYYFIGGSANWGNIRGIIKNNIYDLKLFEEGMFKKSSLNDIWGISDLELFEESHHILEKEKKPFFAFIQTAGYHKPYTIPKRREGFVLKELSEDDLQKYGYFNNDEYNALRFSDHALGYYLNLAKKSDYFKNTVFVIYADHGLRSYDAKTLSSFYRNHKFPVYHIPLVIYSPLFTDEYKGKVNSTLGYQPDILPTVLSMIGQQGPNSTFGVDLFSAEAANRKGIFLRGDGAYPAKFFDGENMVYSSLDNPEDIKAFKTTDFVTQLYHSTKAEDFINKQLDLKKLDATILQDIKHKASIGRSYYKAVKYKLRHNQKSKIEGEISKIEKASLSANTHSEE